MFTQTLVPAQYQLQILSKINKKGWNVYKSTELIQLGSHGLIREGPVSNLEVMERYVLLPIVDDSCDPRKVMAKLDEVATRLDGRTPTIEIDGERNPWTGFIPRESDVKVNTSKGHFIPYDHFVFSLGTIFQI